MRDARPLRDRLYDRLEVAMLRPPLPRAQRDAATVVLAALVVGTGVLDAVSGSQVTVGVLYLLLVVAAATITGPRRASLVAAVAAVVWVAADRQLSPEPPAVAVDVLNTVLRFTILLVVVALLAALRTATERAVTSERRSKDFLAYIAHQLRTPTATVTATAQRLLAEGRYRDEDEAALLRLTTEAHRSGRLLSSILRFVRLDDAPAMRRTNIDLIEVVEAELDRFRARASPVVIDLQLECGPARPIVVGNAEALQEALGNLVQNGLRHALARIEVRIREIRGRFEIVISDDGPGLPDGGEEAAFEPFTTLDGHGGTGLGLAIARRLAEGQGGSLVYRDGAFVLVLHPPQAEGC